MRLSFHLTRVTKYLSTTSSIRVCSQTGKQTFEVGNDYSNQYTRETTNDHTLNEEPLSHRSNDGYSQQQYDQYPRDEDIRRISPTPTPPPQHPVPELDLKVIGFVFVL